MIRPIERDVMFLSRPSEKAEKKDIAVAKDLLDTLHAHQNECVGMAANMIGVNKRIIVMNAGLMDVVMFNPVMIHKEQKYETEEGCLSLTGTRKTERYRKITVTYEDMSFHKHTQTFTGFPAQILQHEMDHLEGKVI